MAENGLPPPPRALLFDWDNTLADNWAAITESLNAAFVAFGRETWTPEEARARVRKSLRDSFPEMFGDAWRDARKVFYDRFEAVHMDFLQPLAGAEAALDALSGAGLYMAVVSNKSGKFLRREVAGLGWQDYFSAVIGATDADADKPDPAPVHMALSGSGIDPAADVWFIGDGAIDVQCAVNAGLTPIVVVRPDTEEELLRHNVVPFVGSNCRVEDMGQLKELVEKLRGSM